MEIKIQITDINEEDLVNLFSSAIYGSNWLSLETPLKFAKESYIDSTNVCEEQWAKILLHGGYIYARDFYADDENDHYGTLPHKWCEGAEEMRYEVNLYAIRDGLIKAFQSNWAKDYVLHLYREPEQLDLDEAETLMQYIIFGECIYG